MSPEAAHLLLQRLRRVDPIALATAELHRLRVRLRLGLGVGLGLGVRLGLGLRVGLRLGLGGAGLGLRLDLHRVRGGRRRIGGRAAPRRDRHLHLHLGQRRVDVDGGLRRSALLDDLCGGRFFATCSS
jgi:hypothetical protein